MAKKAEKPKPADANPDPITGTRGSHPIGTGVGAAVAGAAGTVAGGALAGPAGAIAGAALGAVAGGYAGKGIEESFDPTTEDAYWRDNFHTRPYVPEGTAYETYQPAYRYGWESRGRYEGREFDDVESDLEREWGETSGDARLGWDKASLAVRDAWKRMTGAARTGAGNKPR